MNRYCKMSSKWCSGCLGSCSLRMVYSSCGCCCSPCTQNPTPTPTPHIASSSSPLPLPLLPFSSILMTSSSTHRYQIKFIMTMLIRNLQMVDLNTWVTEQAVPLIISHIEGYMQASHLLAPADRTVDRIVCQRCMHVC
jgi:hypothetical protein